MGRRENGGCMIGRQGNERMSQKHEPLHADFAAEISGIDLGSPLSADELSAIEHAINRYSVLLFRHQNLDDESHLTFTRRLGELEPDHYALGREGRIEYVGVLGNI